MDSAPPDDGPQPPPNSSAPARDEIGIGVDIPDHQLLRCIGRGSYGQVWLARNVMGMYRAVKIVLRESFDHQKPFERELSGIKKFEPISRSFDGFLNILHIGINSEKGYFYYVMELGDDVNSGQEIDPANYAPKTLAKTVKQRGSLPLPDCLQLGLALSRGLAELHKRGLVHRDIKPSNIIFVDGLPKLADIGLVADVGEARSYVGTEGFIPPEGPGTPQADVYGLGKVLYECSTGKDRQDFPELPTLLYDLPDRDGFLELNEIMLHACKTDAAERYASARDMHADLLVVANGRSVKRLKLLERRLVHLKRVAGVAAVIGVVLAGVSYHFYREWKNADEARQRQVGANIAYGNQLMESGDLLGSLPLYNDAFRQDANNRSEADNHRLRLGGILSQCPKLTQMWFGKLPANHAMFSPDGASVLAAEKNGLVKVYDIATGSLLQSVGSEAQLIRTAAFSASGRWIVTAGEDKHAAVWPARGSNAPLLFPHPDRVLSARFAPDEKRIVTAGKDKLARIFNIETGHIEFKVAHTEPVLFADFSKDGRFLVTASYDGTAQVWDAHNGLPLSPPLKHAKWVTSAAFSPDTQLLITTGFDHKARVWDWRTGKKILFDMNHGDAVKTAEYSPDGQWIMTSCLDGTVRLWSAETLQPVPLNPVLRHSDRVNHAAFAPDGHRIVVACNDGSVRIWDLAGANVQPPGVAATLCASGTRTLLKSSGKIEVHETGTGNPVSVLSHRGPAPDVAELNPNGRFVITAHKPPAASSNAPCQIQVWDAITAQPLAPALPLAKFPQRRALSYDGKNLALSEGDSLFVVNVLSQKSVQFPLTNAVDFLRFSPDNQRLTAFWGNEVFVWDVASGVQTFPALKHRAPVTYVEFSADSRLLISSCADNQLNKCEAQVWNAATGQPVGKPLPHKDGVLFATLSRDGKRALTAGEDFRICVWDVASGRQLIPALRHDYWAREAAFDSTGRWIVTASSDRTARIWNANTGDPLGPSFRHLHELTGAMFLEGDRKIVSQAETGRVRVWPLTLEEKPLPDISALTRLLTGNVPDPGSRDTVAESVPAMWGRLRAKYPASFSVAADNVFAWHDFQAADCEVREQWAGAAFHLKYLLSLRPEDQSLAQRRAKAMARSRSAESLQSEQ